MSVKPESARIAAKHEPPAGSITLRKVFGCTFVLVAVPLLGLVLLFYFAGLNAKEWKSAKPARMSVEAWADKRSFCEAADLGAVTCANTPIGEVRRLGESLAKERKRRLCAADARGQAIVEAKELVSAQLRAPSTADFVGDSRTSNDGCDWVVSGEVDAQNGFGGTVRSGYRVKLRRATDRIWLPLEVSVR